MSDSARSLAITAPNADDDVAGVLASAVPVTLGELTGEIAAEHDSPVLRDWLRGLDARLESGTAAMGTGRNRHLRVDAPLRGGVQGVLVKSFGRLSILKDLRDRKRGSKARRTWLAARHLQSSGVGTPAPIGYLDEWRQSRLVRSYYIALYEGSAVTLRDALQALFAHESESAHFIALLDAVARGVRAMHDSGFVHLDLGPRNILVKSDGPLNWHGVQFVDLNRGRRRAAGVPLSERGLDMSRLSLPSHLQRLFIKMYWDGHPPAPIWRWDRLFRRLHRWRVRSRRWFHPIREARVAREGAQAEAAGAARYPAPRDMWVWDERPAQPIALFLHEDRRKHTPSSRSRRMALDTLRLAGAVAREYRPLIDTAFRKPVGFAQRVGVAFDGTTIDPARELALVGELGRIPVIVRFGHHESRERRHRRIGFVRALHAAGHRVAITLSQDRKAVLQPVSWNEYAFDIVEHLADVVDYVEVGRSVNRVKWGIWCLEDLRLLYRPVEAMHARFPGIRFIGPAAIDFDYPFIPAALREWPAGVRLSALSHQLYVDRRGAPENPQGPFGALEKFALARAIARASPICDDSLIISEVNWALRGTGAHSPVGSPYEFVGQRDADVAVNEDDYADYMLRYLLLAIGSGFVDRVYWWRLVARGFGLVDDTNPGMPRPRPAYAMLRNFLQVLGEGRMIDARTPPRKDKRHGPYRFAFERPDGETVVLLYAHGPELPFPRDEAFGRVDDAFGTPIAALPARLTGRPVYLRNASA